MTTLIFPSSLDASVVYARLLKRHGIKVIGTSSLSEDVCKNEYDTWYHIPYIHEPNFLDELNNIINKHNISSIYTPHAPSYLRLSELKENLQDVSIIGDAPYFTQINRVKHAYELAQITTDNAKEIPFIAGILDQATHLYGECSVEKILGLISIFKQSVQGDVIEIGSFFGKSALILNRLANFYNIGSCLAIDPWSYEDSVQHSSTQIIQELSAKWDWEWVFKGFLMQCHGCHRGNFNYLRMTAQYAWQTYQSTNLIFSPEFGNTSFTGKISVLHIDGNHDESEVVKNYEDWSQRLLNKAWVIFDDYEWSQGAGPKKVADHLLKTCSNKITEHFIRGGAMFIQFGK